MRMKLFHLSHDVGLDRHTVQIVAPDVRMAIEFCHANLEGFDMHEHSQARILRIDETLTGDSTQGLDLLLESAPVSFASFAEGLGWIAHVAPITRLCIYRIETACGDVAYVIAPNSDVAAAVWFDSHERPDGEPVLFRIDDGLDGLDERQRDKIEPFLKFGPIGMLSWQGERGWSP